MSAMRSGLTRILATVLLSAFAALGSVASASAHGGATLAEGGSDGVRILLQGTDATTSGGAPAVDLSTVVRGSGTDDATVTFWVRPAGGETFRVAAETDESGVSHADVATADRGDWRNWDVSAVVQLNDGTRLRVSNAEANPPGPDPASTAGGGATGPDPDSGEGAATTGGTETTESETEGEAESLETETTTETESEAAPATTTERNDDSAPVSDVTGEDKGTPGWVIPSLIAVVILAGVWFAFFRRPKDDGEDPEER